jgi:hypothetical protein
MLQRHRGHIALATPNNARERHQRPRITRTAQGRSLNTKIEIFFLNPNGH